MRSPEEKIYMYFHRLYPVFLSNKTLYDKAVEIASTNMPSSAFTRAISFASFSGLDVTERMSYAKFTRWLAVLRRDYGEDRFRKTVSELENILTGNPATRTGISNHSIPQGKIPQFKGIMAGIYKYGHYGWLGQSRVEKIRSAMRALFNKDDIINEQLALEIFYSLYLLRTDLAEHRIHTNKLLRILSDLTKPIRENKELRAHTVLDELLSVRITAEILARLQNRLADKEKLRKLLTGVACTSSASGEDKEAELLNTMKEIVEAVSEKRWEEYKDAEKVIDKMSNMKGVGHKIDFTDKIELAELLRKHKVFVSNILNAIQSVSNKPGRVGGDIVFDGYRRMETLSELPKIHTIEFAYPETYFLHKLATKNLNVAHYRLGQKEKSKKYIVLIDKSGSMGGEKIEWAKAVAVSLLLKSRADDVKVIFFDYMPFPDEPLSFKKDPVNTLKKVLSVRADGGTSIDNALEMADKLKDHDIVLITDGVDNPSYRPRNRLITIFIDGDNDWLRDISYKYFSLYNLTMDVVEKIID